MKRIEAYVAPHRLTPVVHQLHELPGLTVNRGDGIVVISEVSELLRIRETTGQSESRVEGAMPVKVRNGVRGRRTKRGGNP